jgi:tRNA-2-methylthio-N6-dimethylallyladenosine synthase
MREIRFDSAFMFSYSERELTLAARKIEGDVPSDVKKQRLQEIIAVQEQLSREIYQQQVGRTEQILIHSKSKRSDEQVVGRTDGFKSVIVQASAGGPGDLIGVTIERATMATLFGTPVAASTR